MKLIHLTERNFNVLHNFLKEHFYVSVFAYAHLYEGGKRHEVDYEPVLDYLNDKGLEQFKKNISGDIDSFTDTLSQINNALNVSNTIDAQGRFTVLLQRAHMSKIEFFKFLESYSKGMPTISRTDKLLSNLVKNYNKTHILSLDTANVEKDKNAATIILKGLLEKSIAITTLCDFLYNVFSVLYGCNLTGVEKRFVSGCLKLALSESNIGIDALNSNNIRKVMAVNFVPNADFIVNNSDEIKSDLINNIDHIV